MKTMTPGEETRSLRKFPLPSEVINLTEDDNLLPSRIYHIDRRQLPHRLQGETQP